MVKLTEVEDEHFQTPQPGPTTTANGKGRAKGKGKGKPGAKPNGTTTTSSAANDDDGYTTTDSSLNSSSDEDSDNDDDEDSASLQESLLDRIYALRDILPLRYRTALSSKANTLYRWSSNAVRFGGKGMFVVTTGAMMLGVPYALAVAEEQNLVAMEAEARMQEQAGELIRGGGLGEGLAAGQRQGQVGRG